MYRVITFWFEDNHLTVKIDKGPKYDLKETADNCARILNKIASAQTPFERSIIHGIHVPVEIITKGQFYEAKWNEFSKAWNNSVKPDTLNPLETFDTWINYYDYLTASQYMKTL